MHEEIDKLVEQAIRPITEAIDTSTIITQKDQLNFKKQYLNNRNVKKDLFYFDGSDCVDGNTGMNIPKCRLPMSYKELAAILDKHFNLKAVKHEDHNPAAFFAKAAQAETKNS